MPFHSHSDSSLVRCGRCATQIPDDFQTFCSSCGIPFCNIPPTNSYTTFEARKQVLEKRRTQWKVSGVATFLFTIFWVLNVLIHYVDNQLKISQLKPLREVRIYTYQVPGYPRLSNLEARMAIAFGMQAFEDHFHFSIADWQVFEETLPNVVEADIKECKSALSMKRGATCAIFSLSYWIKYIQPKFNREFLSNGQKPVEILISNMPFFADEGVEQVETAHIGNNKMISGLAHPSFIYVSTYRLFHDSHLKIRTTQDRARFLGEFVLSHELGHALLGLKDYVLEGEKMRAPSSHVNCIMHSDEKGAYAAWSSVRARSLGIHSECQSYQDIMAAFQLRGQAILALKTGTHEEAFHKYDLAIQKAESISEKWILEEWKKEQKLSLSFIRRWLDP